MDFIGLDPLQENFPNVEVTTGLERFDLHNEGTLNSVEYDFITRALSVRWRVESLLDQEPPLARVALVLHGVRELSFTGAVLDIALPEEQMFDAIWYQQLPRGLGEIRLSLSMMQRFARYPGAVNYK